MKAIIGGTGFYSAGEVVKNETIMTKYGEVDIEWVKVNGVDICFLPRHGKSHNTPPHRINYRANMEALRQIGVKEVYATCAVGSMNVNYAPGDLVVITDFIDMTKNRIITIFDENDPVTHVEMSDPYCKKMRAKLWEENERGSVNLKGSGVYVCTEGPRFETASEIRMYQKMGGDLVGMTNVPEVVMAKEAGLCYAAVGIVTNWCTGVQGEEITLHDIQAAMGMNKAALTEVFINILCAEKKEDQDQTNKCHCSESLIIL